LNTFSEVGLLAHENIGGHEALSKWPAKIHTDFYLIATRLLPTEIKRSEGEGLTVIAIALERFMPIPPARWAYHS
jgi:hypothetical protein